MKEDILQRVPILEFSVYGYALVFFFLVGLRGGQVRIIAGLFLGKIAILTPFGSRFSRFSNDLQELNC